MYEQLIAFLFTAHFQGYSQSTRSLSISDSALLIQIFDTSIVSDGDK
jgi:hypothetical protein